MSSQDTLMSSSQKLHRAIHEYITLNPGLPQRQIKAGLAEHVDELCMKVETIGAFISAQKNCGLIRAVKHDGSPSVYYDARKFSWQLLVDLNKHQRDTGSFSGFLSKVNSGGVATLQRDIAALILKYGVEKFFNAIPVAMKQATGELPIIK